MKTLAFICLFLTSTLYAGSVEWNGQIVKYDDQWSLKNYSTQELLRENIKPGTTIYASFFSKETPNSPIFPVVQNLTLIECALDNVFIPPGVTVKTVYRNPPIQYKVQNDLRDWILDQNSKPVKLIDENYWAAKGFSISTADIPSTPINSTDDIKKSTGTVVSTQPVTIDLGGAKLP